MDDTQSLHRKVMADELMHQCRKPPLGLRPWWIVGEHRLAEIRAAIFRYRLAGWSVPWSWRMERRLWRLLLRR